MAREVKLHWILIALLVVWGGLFYPSIASTVEIWMRSETFNHCFIILPVCIYIIHQKWQLLTTLDVKPNWLVSVPLIGVLMVWLFGSLAQLLVIEQGAAFMVLPLAIWLILGNNLARHLWFPMVFWMFSVPFGEFLVPILQELTADITVFLIQQTGIPVFRDGLYIAIPGGLFEVAVACSGIRYLIASVTLGMLFAYLNYQSAKKRIIFMIFAFMLPLIANGIRAYGIVMIAHLSDMKYATGVDHLIYGWLFFGVVILIMFSVGQIWAEPAAKLPEGAKAKDIAVSSVTKPVAGVFALVLLSLVYQNQAGNVPATQTPDIASIFPLAPEESESNWFPKFTNPTAIHSGLYNGQEIYVAFYAENVQGRELINTTNLLYNTKSWSIVQRWSYDKFTVLQIVNAAGEKRFVAYSYFIPSTVSPALLYIKLWQGIRAFMGLSQQGAFIAIAEREVKSKDTKASVVETMKRLTEQGYNQVFQGD